MIKQLSLDVFEKEIPELREFPEFENPIVHFAMDPKSDPYYMLPNGIITNHRLGKVSIWWLLSEENIKIAEEIRNDGSGFFFRHMSNAMQDAHCIIPCPDGTFLSFFEFSSIGIRFDPKNKRAFIFDSAEIFWPEEKVIAFATTAFVKPDSDFFYSSCLRELPDGTKEICDVEIAYDFSRWKKIRISKEAYQGDANAPHMARVHEGIFYDSYFKEGNYLLPQNGKQKLNREELAEISMRKLFESYQKIHGGSVAVETFEDSCLLRFWLIKKLSPSFEKFLQNLKTRLGCDQLNDVVFEKLFPNSKFLPGRISYFPLSNPDFLQLAETTNGSPAHFEFSKNSNTVYVSSHNFDIFLDGIRYFWPASIDRFELFQGELRKTGTFDTPRWYRFTSHRVFQNALGEFIATIGQPNRFYIVNARTMQEAFHIDLARNDIDSVPIEDVPGWVRKTHSGSGYPYFRPFEISENGNAAYVPFKNGAVHVQLTAPSPEKKEIRYGNSENSSTTDFDEKFKQLTSISAHCYKIPPKWEDLLVLAKT